MALSLMFAEDSFYFGVVPVVRSAVRSLGVPPVRVAQGALLGQMTTGFPLDPLTPATFLVNGLSQVELAEIYSVLHLLMTMAGAAFGIFTM